MGAYESGRHPLTSLHRHLPAPNETDPKVQGDSLGSVSARSPARAGRGPSPRKAQRGWQWRPAGDLVVFGVFSGFSVKLLEQFDPLGLGKRHAPVIGDGVRRFSAWAGHRCSLFSGQRLTCGVSLAHFGSFALTDARLARPRLWPKCDIGDATTPLVTAAGCLRCGVSAVPAPKILGGGRWVRESDSESGLGSTPRGCITAP
jgi:hypothetical protein